MTDEALGVLALRQHDRARPSSRRREGRRDSRWPNGLPRARLGDEDRAACRRAARGRRRPRRARCPSPMTNRPIGVSARSSVVRLAGPSSGHLVEATVERVRRRRGPPPRRDSGSWPPRRSARAWRPGPGSSRSDRVRRRAGGRAGIGAGAGRGPRVGRRARPTPGPRYSAQRLRGSTTAPPPVATIRRIVRVADRVGRGPRRPVARGVRKAASPSSAKISGIDRPVADLDPLVEVDERGARWRCASRLPTTLLPLPGRPTSTTSIGGQSSPPEPASSVPVRPCASRPRSAVPARLIAAVAARGRRRPGPLAHAAIRAR